MSEQDRTTAGTSTPPTPAGDPLGTVLDVLDVEELDTDLFRGRSLPQPGGRVFGGQVLAQSLLAAARTVADARLPHSLHGYFLRAGDAGKGITFMVERLRDGRSFSARRVHAMQGGQPILTLTASFQESQPGLEHTDSPPQATPPPESVPSALDVLGSVSHPVATFWTQTAAFDIRHVEESIYLDAAATSTSRQMVWMRARGVVPDAGAASEVWHRALMAYACDQVMLEPLLRRHGRSWATPGLSIASLDHAMWFHRPARVDEWLLYVQYAPSASGGRGLGSARVYRQDGTLVASIAQEGMLRVPDAD
ncbi:acyl-CoA thioesterase [Actinotalea fermentans]|uniref:Acyl-CoA thioesterase 2 n=1 Tax=Actinotalea fermentans TaxID=43671 RepID=A0A511YW38_9CELL|nr:acyl-CoA thioesterase II [Actinotalea fermentans]GEN79434.1 acyl-CoA thioesterase II [Actinotalea fermentans]